MSGALGVLDREIQRAGGEAYPAGRDLIEARADIAELIEAAKELRQRQRDYLSDPKGARVESKGVLVGLAAARLDAALAALTQQPTPGNGGQAVGEVWIYRDDLDILADPYERKDTPAFASLDAVGEEFRSRMVRFVRADLTQQQHQPEARGVVDEVWLFKGTDGAWHTFLDERHRLDTIADGRWDVRKFAALGGSS